MSPGRALSTNRRSSGTCRREPGTGRVADKFGLFNKLALHALEVAGDLLGGEETARLGHKFGQFGGEPAATGGHFGECLQFFADNIVERGLNTEPLPNAFGRLALLDLEITGIGHGGASRSFWAAPR